MPFNKIHREACLRVSAVWQEPNTQLRLTFSSFRLTETGVASRKALESFLHGHERLVLQCTDWSIFEPSPFVSGFVTLPLHLRRGAPGSLR